MLYKCTQLTYLLWFKEKRPIESRLKLVGTCFTCSYTGDRINHDVNAPGQLAGMVDVPPEKGTIMRNTTHHRSLLVLLYTTTDSSCI